MTIYATVRTDGLILVLVARDHVVRVSSSSEVLSIPSYASD